MKAKKLVSLILALIMVLSFSVIAFADDEYDTAWNAKGTSGSYKVDAASQEITLTSSTKVPKLRIYMEKTGVEAVLNPYEIAVSVNGSNVRSQVISAAHFIGSLSEAPVNVGVKTLATPSADVTLLTAAPKATNTEKGALIFLAMDNLPAGTTDANANSVAETKLKDVTYNATAAKSGSQVLFSADEVERTDPTKPVITIAKASSADAPSFVGYKVLGQVVKTPESSWTTSDTIDLKITFSFNLAADTST